MNKRTNISILLLTIIALTFFVGVIQAQTTTFTYQGKLTDTSMAANGVYDFEFALYDAAAGGTLQGAAQTTAGVTVTNGVFTAPLDFGATPFSAGADRYLEIRVKKPADASYTILAPRQRVTSAPYAVHSLEATTAGNALKLNGIAASGYLQTNGSGSGLTNLNASQITTGTLSDAQLSANIARRNAANTFAGDQTVNGNLTQTGTTVNLTVANGFVASGTYDTGAMPASGAGTRMMFYPRKAAFRAGYINSTQWDDANVGAYSTATGYNTTAKGFASTAMGSSATASGSASTAMGSNTTASGNYSTATGIDTIASGNYSTAMGQSTIASGFGTTAMGNYASTNNQSGSFIYGDNSFGTYVYANAGNSWTIRASGGYRFFSNSALTTGVSLSAGGGSWTSLSDRNAKDNIISVNPRDVLRGVLGLPIATWNYKGQPQFRHIGAMAQDFYATFKVGENDKTITTVDPDGVALAAIQGLNEELKDRDVKIERQHQQLQEQQRQLSVVQQQVKQQLSLIDSLRKIVCQTNAQADIYREK